MPVLLSIENLSVAFQMDGRWEPVVRQVSLQVDQGEFVGLVGESGAGKSILALSLLRLLPPGGRITGGRVRLGAEDLSKLSELEMRKLRGGRIGIVFQEPASALNPVFAVGFQVAEAVRAHRRVSRAEARSEAERLLDLVGVSPARERLAAYPHQLSGGQQQRVVIAMALASEPDLLIADEPTSALDVTVQARILELLKGLCSRLKVAVLLISHDLAVVAGSCDRLAVMYAGQLVEQGSTTEVFASPAHPYTRGLLGSVPRLGRSATAARLPSIPGQAPQPGESITGCSFHPRCNEALELCAVREPRLVALGPGRSARCLLMDGPYESVDGDRGEPS
jgi:peptide/nickel transport system ATP-binding protein